MTRGACAAADLLDAAVGEALDALDPTRREDVHGDREPEGQLGDHEHDHEQDDLPGQADRAARDP